MAPKRKHGEDDDKKQERFRAAFEAYQRDQKEKEEEREKRFEEKERLESERLAKEIEERWGKLGEIDDGDLFGEVSTDDEDSPSHADKKVKFEHMLSDVESASNFLNEEYRRNLAMNKLALTNTPDENDLIQMIMMYTTLSFDDTRVVASYNEGFEHKIELMGEPLVFTNIQMSGLDNAFDHQFHMQSVDLQSQTVRFDVLHISDRVRHDITLTKTSPNPSDWDMKLNQRSISQEITDIRSIQQSKTAFVAHLLVNPEREYLKFINMDSKASFSIAIKDRQSAFRENIGMSFDNTFVWTRRIISHPDPVTVYIELFKNDGKKVSEIVRTNESYYHDLVIGFTLDNRYFVIGHRIIVGGYFEYNQMEILLYDPQSGQLVQTYTYKPALGSVEKFRVAAETVLTTNGIWFLEKRDFTKDNSDLRFLEFPTKGNDIKESESLPLPNRSDYSRLRLLPDGSVCVFRKLYYAPPTIEIFVVNPKVQRYTKDNKTAR